GNLLKNRVRTYTVDGSNHLAAATGAVYDARGDLTQFGPERYTWDGLARMSSYSTDGSVTNTYKYAYDGLNERVGKLMSPSAGGAWNLTLRDEANHVATEQVSGVVSRDNVFLGRLLLASYSNCTVSGNCRLGSKDVSSWQYFSSDHLGSPRLITDSAGSV